MHEAFLSYRVETPPRTWRRLLRYLRPRVGRRNTSTDVEKTARNRLAPSRLRKHLHGRGEDKRRVAGAARRVETPPRTWRRLGLGTGCDHVCGNTSTDVEKTFGGFFVAHCLQKHLHGRGEDTICWSIYDSELETPPRTWRRPVNLSEDGAPMGNTSTDVEKTRTGRSTLAF